MVVDAINVKVRDGQVPNRPVYAAIGVDPEGHKDILGMWISGGGGESAKFWMVVLTELRNHGVAVFFLVCDGLKGLPDSVNAVWFATIVQTCLIHLIRNSFRFASRKYWDGLSRYPAIIRLWRNARSIEHRCSRSGDRDFTAVSSTAWDALFGRVRAARYWLRPHRRRPVTREEGCAMPRKQQLTWTVVLRLAVVVTGGAGLVVLGGGTGLWVVEGKRPDSTMRSWGDALWWSLTTLTTVGYGDQIPVTTTGRLIAAGVMVAGVAVIGAVAAIVALAVALRVARQEELAFEAAAEILEQRLDVRLARIEAQVAGLDARLQAWSTVSADDDVCSGGDDQ